jgi:hypothetical protein
LTITRAVTPLVVTAHDGSRAYGQTNPVFTGAISGLLNDDPITASYSSLATVATPAGVYGPASSNAIKPVLADPEGRLANYTVITNNGTLTITRTPVTITVANATRRVLMPDPPFTGTFSGLLPWDSAIAESVPYASSATFTSPPGDYPIYPAWPSPPAGLENYTLTTNLGTLSITGAVPTITILAPTNGSIFYAGMEVPLVAEVQPTGGVQQVDFLVGTNQFGATTTNGGIYEGTFTNIPAGSYSLTGRVVSLFGLTNYSDPVNFTVLQDVGCTLEPVDLTSLEVRQTGLYMQDVRIPNLAPIPIRSLRVAVSGLPASVSVWNATYVSNGVYYLQYDFPTAPGATNSMRLELYSRDGRDPGLTLTNIQVRVSRPLPPLDLTNGVPERLDRIVYNFTLGTVLLQFFTTNRATYYVEYAAGVPSEGGGTNWILSRPAITGNGNWQNWLDDGPPKTQSRPDADPAGQRFYRLLRVP